MLLIRLNVVNLKQLDFQISNNVNIFLWWGQHGKIYFFFHIKKLSSDSSVFKAGLLWSVGLVFPIDMKHG